MVKDNAPAAMAPTVAAAASSFRWATRVASIMKIQSSARTVPSGSGIAVERGPSFARMHKAEPYATGNSIDRCGCAGILHLEAHAMTGSSSPAGLGYERRPYGEAARMT